MKKARELLRSAVEQARSEIPAEQVAGEIDRATALGETVGAVIENCTAEGIRKLYQRANEHLAHARRNLDGGKQDSALSEARIARNLFNRIREICAR